MHHHIVVGALEEILVEDFDIKEEVLDLVEIININIKTVERNLDCSFFSQN